MRVRAGLAALLPLAVLVPASPAAAAAVDEPTCSDLQVEQGAEQFRTELTSAPLEQLGIQEAHDYLRARGVEPGAGVTVAVLDSGVTTAGGVSVAGSVTVTGQRELQDYHGTAVAGLIAGNAQGDQLVGVAPGARILDVRVYDVPTLGSTEGQGVTPDGIVAGLKEVLRHPEVGVVNISLFVDRPDERIERLVDRLRRRDVLVVAAAGNRPLSGEPLAEEFGEDAAGQDAADRVFPARYDSVLAVSATADGLEMDDASASVLPNSATDLAAPVAGAISVGVDGGTCWLGEELATSWAAAEVSGVIALMRSLDPAATADQVATRLLATADGRADVPTLLVGAGTVKPLAALRHPVSPAEDGSLAQTAVSPPGREVAPEPEPDTMVGSRRRAVWWGVLGGGALLLALVVRPLVAGRRRPAGGLGG